MANIEGFKVKDRSGKVARRKGRMPVNGQSFKALLIERAANAQREAGRNVKRYIEA